MKRVVVESPYAGATEVEVERNVTYARLACLDCLARGESPYASHLLFTQFLDDTDPDERSLGISAGFAWGVGVVRVFYLDLGMSRGMQLARSQEGIQEDRRLAPILNEWLHRRRPGEAIPAGLVTLVRTGYQNRARYLVTP